METTATSGNLTTQFFGEKFEEFSDYSKISIRILGDIDADKTHVSKNITGPLKYCQYWIFYRKVKYEDIRNIKQDKMPSTET